MIGLTLVLLAILIDVSKLPEIPDATSRPGEKVNDSVWKHPNLCLQPWEFSLTSIERS